MFIGKPFPSQNLSGRNKTNWKITEPPAASAFLLQFTKTKLKETRRE